MSKKGKKAKEKKFSSETTPTVVEHEAPWYKQVGNWMGTGYGMGSYYDYPVSSDKGGNGKGKKGKDHKAWAPCYETHPPLKIGEYTIYGGSCSKPVVKDADLYVGFDTSMTSTDLCYPWTSGYEFLYYIQDMHAPKNPESFKKLIMYLEEQLKAGTKIHIGCIGGHGRTGTVLAALVKHMTGVDDAITYVRDNYCKKAVETSEQIEFLHKHFGITKVAGTKDYSHGGGFGKGGGYDASYYGGAGSMSVPHMSGHASCIWGSK